MSGGGHCQERSLAEGGMCVSAAHRQDPAVGRTQRVLPTFYRGERERVPRGGKGVAQRGPHSPGIKIPAKITPI